MRHKGTSRRSMSLASPAPWKANAPNELAIIPQTPNERPENAAPASGHENETAEGRYRFLVELGQGGTANVYLAVARGLSGFNKLVVLKALKKNLSNDGELRKMFMDEARLSARLNHPNIVQTNQV